MSYHPVLIKGKKRHVQNVTGSFAQLIRNEYEFRITATFHLKTNTIDLDVEIIMTNFEM